MAPDTSKFQSPEIKGDLVDVGKFKKLAQRVEQSLTEDILFAEPKQLDPDLVPVAPNNRDGAPTNKSHLHFGVLKSFKVRGFDRTRPHIGICIKFTSEKGLKDLHEHNLRFTKGCKLMPPIKDGAIYGSLATSHFNLALRCIKSGTFSPIGNIVDLLADNKNLKEVVTSGHRWWILPESVLKERQVDISLWRNMDQNENQNSHEMEILGGIKATAESLSKKQSSVKQADLMAAAVRRNPAKVRSTSMLRLCQLYIGFLDNDMVHLVDELIDWHSEHVDPKELTMSIRFLQSVCTDENLSKCPEVRLGLLQLQYNDEKVLSQSAGPAFCAFLEPSNITSLVKKPDVLGALEKKLREIKSTYLPMLEKGMSKREASLELGEYVCLILRCLFSKAWPAGSSIVLKPGQYSAQKIEDIGCAWAKKLDLKFPDLNFSETSGLQGEPEQDDEDQKEVDLEGLRTLKKTSSGPPDPDMGPKFSRGDEVTLTRRFTWSIPQKGQPKYKKDVVEGTEGVIEGFADMENRLVLLKVTLNLPSGKNVSITKETYPRNLKLTSEYNLDKGVPEEAASGSKDDKKKDVHRAPEFVKGSSSSDDVKAFAAWKNLVADQDKAGKLMSLKSRIGVSLQALGECLPTYSDKDLVLVGRKNDKGTWKNEIWTKRAFEPYEIQFGPFSSQLKETHLMAAAHAVLGLPKHGRGAHPENGSLALDGRGKTLLAPAGVASSEAHTGIFYWACGRTSKASEANLIMENINFEHSMKVSLPAPKKRKVETCTWDSSEMPHVPILLNKKKIDKHVQLLVFLPDNKKS